jgi:conserved domain protein
VKYPSVAHFDNPYLSISRHGATQDEWNGCKFPIVTIQGGKTYTLSMFVRIYGSDQPYIEVKRSRSKDMSAPKTSYANIPSSYGVWKPYTHTFEMEEGYNYLQIFIGCTRNGEAYLSEMQLEEGTKATTWKDPDVIESIKRAGVNITLGRIEARADNFVIRNSEGKLTTVIDENGQLIAGSLRTQDRGNGYMTLEGNQQSFFKHGIPHPMRWIGYTSEGWVERMYDDVGNLIWENGVNGQIFKMRPERWEDIASHVIVHGISTLDYFFNIHGTNALSKIFQSNKDEQYNVYKYHAARDVRGNIIATSQTNPIQSVRDSDGVLFSQKDIKGTKFSGIIRTNIITLCTVNYRSNNSSMTIEEDQEERRSLEISADFIRSRIEELRKKFSLYNTYNVEVRIGVPLYCTQIAVYKDGILTGDYYLYANEKDVNKNNLNM